MTVAKPTVCHVTVTHATFDIRIFHKECDALVKAGYDVHLVAPHERDEVVRDVHVHGLPQPKGRFRKLLIWPWLVYRKVMSLKPRPTVCHIYEPGMLLAGALMSWRGVRVIYDVRENTALQILSKSWLPVWVRRPMAWTYKLVESIAIRRMATVHVLDSIAERYPQPRVTVRNLPKLGVYLPRTPRQADEPIRLLYVGGVSVVRGAMTMVDLVAELKRRGVASKLRIIGPWEDVNIEARLRERIAEAGVEDDVTAPGRLPYEEAVKASATADIGLCVLHPIPNYLNSLSTKILEYMQHEVPVIASNFDCWRELVEEPGSGVLVDPLSVEAIADAVEHMVANPEEMAEMGRRGREAVLKTYNWDVESRKLVEFYEMLLANDGKR